MSAEELYGPPRPASELQDQHGNGYHDHAAAGGVAAIPASEALFAEKTTPSRSDRSDRSDRERDRDRDRERDRDRDRSSRSDRERDRDRDRDRDRERGERSSDRDRERDRDRDRERERDRGGSSSGSSSRRRSRSPPPSRSSRSGDKESSGSSSSSSSKPAAAPVVTLDKRIRRVSLWDLPPPGCEHLTPMQVKSMGLFGPPQNNSFQYRAEFRGAPGGGGNPINIQNQINAPYLSGGSLAVPAHSGGDATAHRQARRLYIGNIPSGFNENDVIAFLNETFLQNGISNGASGNPIVSNQFNQDKNFAFVEFRTPEEATRGLALDGLSYNGASLRVKRPKDYVALASAGGVPGGSFAVENPNKLVVNNIPTFFTEDQVKELIGAFGALKTFELVKDLATAASKGIAYCEYADPEVTELALQGLDGMDLGEAKLAVHRVSATTGLASLVPLGGTADPTLVLQLLNMVTEEELYRDDEYEDIVEDVRDECNKFGKVASVKIPRPSREFKVPGVGKIYVEFENIAGCSAAFTALAGRKFASRTVVTSYYNEDKYANSEFE